MSHSARLRNAAKQGKKAEIQPFRRTARGSCARRTHVMCFTT
jgi:hypothetical protein